MPTIRKLRRAQKLHHTHKCQKISVSPTLMMAKVPPSSNPLNHKLNEDIHDDPTNRTK